MSTMTRQHKIETADSQINVQRKHQNFVSRNGTNKNKNRGRQKAISTFKTSIELIEMEVLL